MLERIEGLPILSSENEAFWFYDLKKKDYFLSPGFYTLIRNCHCENELDFFPKLIGKGETTLAKVIGEYNRDRSYHSNIFFWRNDTEVRWIEDIGFRIQVGEVLGILGHSRDITRIQSFKNRNHLIEQMGVGMDICLWTIDFTEHSISLDFPGRTGQNDVYSLDQQSKLIHPEERNQYFAEIQKTQKEKCSFHFEGRVSRNPSVEKWKWIRSIGIPVFENEELKEISGFSYVIDHEREDAFKIASLNEELNHSKQEIHKSYKGQQQFVSDVTSEMRPPIDLIISGIQLLEDRLEHSECQGILESIKGASFGLLKLVSGLSDVNKLQLQNGTPGNDRFDIKNLVVSTTELVNLGINFTEKTYFSFAFSSQPPMIIFGHNERIKKLLSHLVAMLLEEVKEGLIEVHIELDQNEKHERLAISYIVPRSAQKEDYDAAQFLERYIQNGESERLGMRSFDFGLTVLRKYAEMAGAELVISTDATHRRYTMNLAYRPDMDNNKLLDSEKTRVLVVDDIDLNRELMAMYLEETDCEILEAENGLTAVSLFQKYHFDLVLMDLQMPQMSGYDAVVLMRQIEQKMGRLPAQIVAISAYAIDEEVERCTHLGFDLALDKPVPKDRILGLVSSCIENYKK